MAYLKVDDNISHHRKLLAAGDVAGWLYICGLAYCQRHKTDGMIPAPAVQWLGCMGWKKAAPMLVHCGLWHAEPGGSYSVHDFLAWNESAAERESKASLSTDRVRRFRERGKQKSNTVTPFHGNATPTPTPRPTPKPFSEGGGLPGAAPSEETLSATGAADEPVAVVVPRRETVADRAAALGLVKPGVWDRQHAGHAWRGDFCGWLCLPQSVVDGFVGRATGAGADTADAMAGVHAWAHNVKARWATSGQIPGEDIFAFWRNEWTREHGSNKPAATRPSGSGLDRLMNHG